MQEFNAMTFLTQGGLVSMTVAFALLAMSVASWSLLIAKLWQGWKNGRSGAAFASDFHRHRSLEAAERAAPGENDYKRLTRLGVEAAGYHQILAVDSRTDICTKDEFTARALQRGLQEAQARMESGLTVLASVGSVVPFVGLFGTVWGIYHALASISASGQASLDKVAGPVGEALIMTAFGLAVAIPLYWPTTRWCAATAMPWPVWRHSPITCMSTSLPVKCCRRHRLKLTLPLSN